MPNTEKGSVVVVVAPLRPPFVVSSDRRMYMPHIFGYGHQAGLSQSLQIQSYFLGCLNVVRKPLRLLAVMLLLLLLASNFIARDWLDLGQIFKKHMTPLIFRIFLKSFSKNIRDVFDFFFNFSKNFLVFAIFFIFCHFCSFLAKMNKN